jgi:hypothetical protein
MVKNSLDTTEGRLAEVRKRLVFYRSWSYLRYVHLREAFLATEGVSTVLSIGCGRALAELALAIEFPEVRFHATDLESPSDSAARTAFELAKTWGIENLTFGRRDILDSSPSERFDLVTSVELLEQLEDDRSAAANMVRASRGYVFCLVPFADREADADPVRRARAWEKDRQHRLGYAEAELRALFPGPAIVRGCYWRDACGPIPSKRDLPDDDALLARAGGIQSAAGRDVRDRIPVRYPEALGIWILARPHDRES